MNFRLFVKRILSTLFSNINVKNNIREILFAISFLALSYVTYFWVGREMAIRLTDEDGFFENVTALFFLATSVVFGLAYLRQKSIFFMLLMLLFFVGFGEEISWGQRIFGIETPESMSGTNLQQEINIHNLELFHPQSADGISKSGLSKLITVDFLYNVFWFMWCIVLPLLLKLSRTIESFVLRIKLPIPALPLGILFLVNFLLFYGLRSTLSANKSDFYYSEFREVYESVSAVIFLVLSISIYKTPLRKESAR